MLISMIELTMPGVTEVLTSWIMTPPPTSLNRRSGRYKKKNDCCDESSRDCKFYRLTVVNTLNAGHAPPSMSFRKCIFDRCTRVCYLPDAKMPESKEMYCSYPASYPLPRNQIIFHFHFSKLRF